MSRPQDDAPIVAVNERGDRIRELSPSVRTVILSAEALAKNSKIRGADAIDRVLVELAEKSGLEFRTSDLSRAIQDVDGMRGSTRYGLVQIPVKASHAQRAENGGKSAQEEPPGDLFEPVLVFPDRSTAALATFRRLAGIDDQKEALIAELSISMVPERLANWSKKHHKKSSSTLLDGYASRTPLIILQGDVGTGKTELATTVAAELIDRGVCTGAHVLKLTNQVRGEGLVGEMSGRLVKAFQYAEAYATRLGPTPLLFVVDEADSIATSRAGSQMHHEDKVAVNTILQRLNNLRSVRPRPVVIFITNRLGDVDPAIARRAGLILRFDRPNAEARKAIFGSVLSDYGFSDQDLNKLTQASNQERPRYTASDIVDKILARALQTALRTDGPLTLELVQATMEDVRSSPEFM